MLSPGGGDTLVTEPHGAAWLAYHARATTYDQPRTLRLDAFSWQPSPTAGLPDVPTLAGPSSTPQPAAP